MHIAHLVFSCLFYKQLCDIPPGSEIL